jgi:hypothetical protein
MIPRNTSLILEFNTPILAQKPRPPSLLLIHLRLIHMIPRTMHPPLSPDARRAGTIPQAGRPGDLRRRLVVHGVIARVGPCRSAIHDTRLLIRAALPPLRLSLNVLPHSSAPSSSVLRFHRDSPRSGLVEDTINAICSPRCLICRVLRSATRRGSLVGSRRCTRW